MENLYSNTIETPIGFLKLTSDNCFLLSISFEEYKEIPSKIQPEILAKSVLQMDEYFRGIRKEFSLNLNPKGTEFQKKVWKLVEKIDFGQTASYLDIAIQTGSSKNTRAVGMANGKNPIPIVTPCHRIIGSNGKLTGYAGGLERKRWLLQHEIQFSEKINLLF